MIDHPSPRVWVTSPPPVALCATPPAQVPPTQTLFARGPGAVGIRTTDATNYCDSFHSWAGGALDHPGLRPPLRRGELFPRRDEPSSPPLEGWWLAAGVVRECGFIHLLSCHSRAGGNRAWVVNNYLILGIIQRYIFYSPAIRDMNLIDPIPAFAGMTRIIAERI